MKDETRQIRIKGIVLPVEWDAEGHAIKAAIFTGNEEEYLIKEDENSKRFLSLFQQEVEVTGLVIEEADQKVITVEHCQTLKQRQTQ
jgi:hypothetical protein